MAAADLTRARWVLDLSEDDLQREVGVLSVARAKVYAEGGRVHTLVAANEGRQLLATVSGAERTRYQTVVDLLDADGPSWSARCSCPVRVQCKHAVAAILGAQLRLRDEGQHAGQDWESLLGPLAGVADGTAGRVTGTEGAAGAAVVRWRMGLQVGLHSGLGGHEEATRVTLVPVREGTGRPWVRQGVSWRDLAASYRVDEVDGRQRVALVSLHTLSQGSLRQGSLRRPGTGPELLLGDLGQIAWPALDRVVRSGVALVPGVGAREVGLGGAEVEAVLDVARTGEGLRVTASVQLVDGSPVEDGRFFVVGRPGHGIGRLSEAGELTLWPLAQEPAHLVTRLLERGRPVVVPPGDTERFLAHYYPSLARSVPVVSRDGSVATGGARDPVLRVVVTAEPAHRVRLRWSVGYPVPEVGRAGDGAPDGAGALAEVPLEHRLGDPPRDLAGEAGATAAVLPLLQPCPELVEHRTPGMPRLHPEAVLAGRRTVTFVSEVLPALRAAPEISVVVEGDLSTYEEALEAPVVLLETTEGAVDDWFDLHVSVTVAGQTVPFDALFAALARGDELMLLESGTYFSLDVPELHLLRRLIEEARQLEDRPPREGTVAVTRWQAGLWEELTEIGVLGRQSAAWHESVGALLALGEGAGDGVAKVPEQLRAELRPYQRAGFEWLSALWDHRLGGVLADDMGLGKTVQTLATVARADERGDLAEGPVLVVAPASVVGVWAAEAARFTADLRVATVTASSRSRRNDLATEIGAADLVVTSYTVLRLDQAAFRELPWSAVVLDEAQAVKNPRSQTYRAVRSLGAVRTFVLTGTPLENSLLDLWSMFSLAAPGLFRSSDAFLQRYAGAAGERDEPGGRDGPVGGRALVGRSPEGGGLEQLRRRMRPFLLRRTKDAVAADLPPKTEQVLSVPLTGEHQRIYDRHLQRERQRVLGLLQDMNTNSVAVFRALTVMRQLALDPGLVDPEHAGLVTSAKITLLVEHLEELAAQGHRALVFSSFTSYLALVREALDSRGISYSYLDGRTRDRRARVEGFRTGDDVAFLISLKAGGVGLTLTEADYVFLLDPWWNPAAEAQAVDRTHRIGQRRAVHVYRMVSTGTVEEKVVGLQERKRQLFRTVVDAGEFRSGRISAADIRGLLEE